MMKLVVGSVDRRKVLVLMTSAIKAPLQLVRGVVKARVICGAGVPLEGRGLG